MIAQKARTGILTLLVAGLGVLGLAGCGGETPTATPVAPTATTSTETTTDPTATLSTETTTDPTATTSTETTDEATPTAGSDSNSGGNEATDKLMKAGAAMDGLTSYHMTIDSEAGGVASKLEVDIEKPDKYRIVTEAQGTSTEILVIGDKSYTKAPGLDQYIEGPADRSLLEATNTGDITASTQGATVVGQETINGVNTTHIHYSASADDASGATGTAETDIWIDESTGYIHKIEVAAESGGVSSTSTITYSKFDEPVSPPIEVPENVMTMP
jgi:outer membrane lipoprotein-sorting protein